MLVLHAYLIIISVILRQTVDRSEEYSTYSWSSFCIVISEVEGECIATVQP